MATLLSHTYETGDSLATLGYTNIVDLSNTSGEGLNGSTWGLRGTGATFQPSAGRARILTPLGGAASFSLSADFDHIDLDNSGLHFNNALELGGLILQHGHWDNPDPPFDFLDSCYTLIYDGGTVTNWESADGVITAGETVNLLLCGEWSSSVGVPDGHVRFSVDGVTLVEFTGVIMNRPALDQVRINPMGRFDNLLLTDGACPTDAEPIVGATVFGTKGTVTSTRTFLANLDDTTRIVNEPGTFYIGGDLIVTGDTTITGNVTAAAPSTLMNSIVTDSDGAIVVDSDGNVVYVNGS